MFPGIVFLREHAGRVLAFLRFACKTLWKGSTKKGKYCVWGDAFCSDEDSFDDGPTRRGQLRLPWTSKTLYGIKSVYIPSRVCGIDGLCQTEWYLYSWSPVTGNAHQLLVIYPSYTQLDRRCFLQFKHEGVRPFFERNPSFTPTNHYWLVPREVGRILHTSENSVIGDTGRIQRIGEGVLVVYQGTNVQRLRCPWLRFRSRCDNCMNCQIWLHHTGEEGTFGAWGS